MTPSELLDMFVDGELDSTREVQLFNALAVNSELRSEFSNMLSIRSNIHADHAAFAPSAAATKSVFAALNFSAPASAATPVVPPSTGWSRVRLSTVSAVVGAGIMALLMWQFGPMSIENHTPVVASTQSIGNGQLMKSPSQPTTVESPNASAIAKSDVTTTQTESTIKTKTTSEPSPTNSRTRTVHAAPRTYMRNVAAPVQSALPDRATRNGALSRIVEPVAVRKEQMPASTLIEAAPTAAPMPKNRINVEVPANTVATTDTSNGAITMQVCSIAAKSFPEISVSPTSDAMPVNIAIGAYRKFSNTTSFGIEVGREAFTQRFSGSNELSPGIGLARTALRDELSSDRRLSYEQNPNVVWACLAYKQEFAKFGDLHALGQVLVGGTELGPLGKLLIGAQFNAGAHLSLLFQVEGSMLAYTFENTWFTSQKAGVRYGMSFSF